MAKAYPTVVNKIMVEVEGNETPFFIHESMFQSFVEWFADQRGVTISEAEDILQNE